MHVLLFKRMLPFGVYEANRDRNENKYSFDTMNKLNIKQ